MNFPELHPRVNEVNDLFSWRDYTNYLMLHGPEFEDGRTRGYHWDAEGRRVVWDTQTRLQLWDSEWWVVSGGSYRYVPSP